LLGPRSCGAPSQLPSSSDEELPEGHRVPVKSVLNFVKFDSF
jgi:hypothetical protein